MIELEKTYTSGRNTFLYRLFFHEWKFHIATLLLTALAWAVYYGPLKDFVISFLERHQDWYISYELIALWTIMLSGASLILSILNTSVEHHHLKFMLDEHAFHLHRGLFFIREVNIPYRQISNVHIDRPYHYRLLGLAQFDIVTTADKDLARIGKPAKDFLIPILDMKIAKELSKQITRFSSLKHSRAEEYFGDQDQDSENEEYDDEEYEHNSTKKNVIPKDIKTKIEDADRDNEIDEGTDIDMDDQEEENHIEDKQRTRPSHQDMQKKLIDGVHTKQTHGDGFGDADDFENEIRNYTKKSR